MATIYEAEIAENLLVKVRNPLSQCARVMINKCHLDEESGEVIPSKRLFANLKLSQYAVLRSLIPKINEEIRLRRQYPHERVDEPILEHLGGNWYAQVTTGYNIVHIRKFYYKLNKPSTAMCSWAHSHSFGTYNANKEDYTDDDDASSTDSGVCLPAKKLKIDENTRMHVSKFAPTASRDSPQSPQCSRRRPLYIPKQGREVLPSKTGVCFGFRAWFALIDKMEKMEELFPQLANAEFCAHSTTEDSLKCWMCNPQN